MAATVAGLLAVVMLTTLGWRDRPAAAASPDAWTLREMGGRAFVERRACAKCHSDTGAADSLELVAMTRGPEWLAGHVIDPEMIAPGLRQPPAMLHEREVAAIVAYVRRLSRLDNRTHAPFEPRIQMAAAVYARYCIGCHVIDGEGGDDGPDLSDAGSKHDIETLRTWITDPEAVDPDAEMPAFGKRLSAAELDAIAGYLAARK